MYCLKLIYKSVVAKISKIVTTVASRLVVVCSGTGRLLAPLESVMLEPACRDNGVKREEENGIISILGTII